MTLTFRPYQDDDLELLQSCIQSWRMQDADGTYCHPGDIPHRLYNGNKGLMPLEDITRIYYHGETVVALLMAYPRHERMDVFIHPDLREQHELFVPVIDAAYQLVCEYRNNDDKADKAVAVDCFQSDTPRQSLLTLAGFRRQKNDMNLTRRNLEDIPEAPLPDGFSIRSVTLDDAEQLANVHSKSFGSNWTAEIYRNEVMLKPGYKPEHEMVVVAPDGTFAAFTVTWRDELNKVGLFEPVGTHEDFRRMGLARAMMCHTMHIMKADGMREAEVAYATDNPASAALYHGIGFETRYKFIAWEKRSSEAAH